MQNDNQNQNNGSIYFYDKKAFSLVEDQEDDEQNQNFFHLFFIYINDLWEYFISPSFIPTYFYENCKLQNINQLNKLLNTNDILDLQFQDKNINIKLITENIIDTQNYKSFTQRSIEVPDDISPFIIIISLYLCSVHQSTGVNIKIIPLDTKKNTFMYDYIFENYKKIFQNISKYIEQNFKEYEHSESISIGKSGDEVWNFLVKNNYSNLKVLLGNNAKIKSTSIPNEIEVEHFTKNNTVKMMVSKNKDFNEKNLFLQIISSTKPLPKQNINLKIININNNSCLFFFIHKMKQFLYSDSLNNYSLIKQKSLWLLKSTLENKIAA